MNTKNDSKIFDKVKGALYGFAIGDAMGATTEFMDSNTIKSTYGRVSDIIGGGWLELKSGQVTDDTQMTMCVADAIVHASNTFKKRVSQNFIDWYKSNPPDIGGQCAKGITALILGMELRVDDSALGNGSLMRALPCALVDCLDWNLIQGRLTHNNKVCDDYIRLYHSVITTLIYKDIDVHVVVGNGELEEPTGYVVNTFANAIYWSNKPTFERCIIGAVNDGGDSDTIAAIAGSISGARYGYSNIPEKWIIELDNDVRTALDKFAKYVVRM